MSEIEKIRLNPSIAVVKLQKLQESPDFTDEQRKLIQDTLADKVSNGKGSVKLMEAILKGDLLNELEKILEASHVSREQVNRMREIMTIIDDEVVVLQELGPDLVKRYFSLIKSRHGDKPYLMPLDLEDGELGAYLTYELNNGNLEYRDDCVLESMKHAEAGELSKVDGNLVLTHLLHRPRFVDIMYKSGELPPEDIMKFVRVMESRTGVRSFYAKVLHYLLFNRERVKNIKKLAKRRYAKSARTHIKKLDAEFFRKINAGFFY